MPGQDGAVALARARFFERAEILARAADSALFANDDALQASRAAESASRVRVSARLGAVGKSEAIQESTLVQYFFRREFPDCHRFRRHPE